MKLFAQLYHQLDIATQPQDKVDALIRYFEQVHDSDKLWMIALFMGKRPRRTVASQVLQSWAKDAVDLPVWLFNASFEVTRDWAETVASILPTPTSPTSMHLADWMQILIELREKVEDEQKEIVQDIWKQLLAEERWVFNKLLTGGFRGGATEKQLMLALEQYTGLENSVLYLRLKKEWDPMSDTFAEILFPEKVESGNSKPYGFHYPDTWDDMETSENPADWQVEWKWHGIRSQTIKREGELFIWNKEEELLTEKFPEFKPFLAQLPDGTVIDGEIVGWKEGIPLALGLLENRINRKNISKKALKEVPVHLIAYDLLECNGEDISQQPLSERREKLEKIIKEAALPDILSLSEKIEFENWDQLADLRKYARDYHTQGFVLKRKAAPYIPGHKSDHWQKWEADLLKVHGVMIYAERENRRSTNAYASYTFAVWQNEELIPFTKAASTLPEAEIQEIENWVKAHTIERFGPVRSVVAQHVFEIGFEGIEASKRRKSGVTLIRPRILTWRQDMEVQEADTLHMLEDMLNRYG